MKLKYILPNSCQLHAVNLHPWLLSQHDRKDNKDDSRDDDYDYVYVLDVSNDE